MSKKSKVVMIGCGKLGLPCAEIMSSFYDVTGFDVNKNINAPFLMHNSLEDAVKNKDFIFIALPTPHHPDYDGSKPISSLPPKDFDYSIVMQTLDQINPHLNKDQLVILISTVLPGTTRRYLRNLVNNARFIYNPYLIAMGSVKWDMTNPECLIIGTEDGNLTRDAEMLIDFYRPITKNNPRINVGTWDEAECIKIFYNTFISSKISLVNMILDVSERNGNINTDIVTDALKAATQRITGPRYMTAGMGDAGACHPRDNIALRWLSDHLNLDYDIFGVIMHSRDIQAKNLAIKLSKLSEQHDLDIVIHGKSYKPYVPYTDGSYSLLVANYLKELNKTYYFADPLTNDFIPDGTKAVILLAHDPEVTYESSQVMIKKEKYYFRFGEGSIIVDPWRKVKNINNMKIVHYGNTRNSA